MPNHNLENNNAPYSPPKPLYEQVKSYVLKRIESGEWPAYYQMPSEHTLVKDMGISRMTIHRALRELTQAGYLERIQGVGTFIAVRKKQRKMLELKEVDEVIRARGTRYHCDIHFLQTEPIESDAATAMDMRPGDSVFRSYSVHRENNIPVMLEDRYVNPDLMPDFLEADFTTVTADTLINSRFALLSHEHDLHAALSNAETHHFLELEDATACLVLNRRTWLGDEILSTVKMLFPGNRYRIT
ncbi:MAG: histidine utilization repressor [Sneathiella sp.]|nr:MAG: histidine utilization repressor [Sneathiella sp.]